MEEQEVYEVEIPEEHITTIKQEKEDTEIDVKQVKKKEKPKHHPKIVKVEPRPTPVSDSNQDDPYVKKFPKERNNNQRNQESTNVNNVMITSTLFKITVTT